MEFDEIEDIFLSNCATLYLSDQYITEWPDISALGIAI